MINLLKFFDPKKREAYTS